MSNHAANRSRLRDQGPLQNRVHADGSLHAVAARGTLMGNRGGRFHTGVTGDAGGARVKNPKRPWHTKQWISCVLSFKDRQRTVWGEGYTEVFFLDEVTAISAGHRPCFECRRADAKAFQTALFEAEGTAQGWTSPPRAKQMDDLLHAARTHPNPQAARLADLPLGAVFSCEGEVMAKATKGPLSWSFEGYTAGPRLSPNTEVELLTPAPMLAALAAGYQPRWHPSAQGKSP